MKKMRKEKNRAVMVLLETGEWIGGGLLMVGWMGKEQNSG